MNSTPMNMAYRLLQAEHRPMRYHWFFLCMVMGLLAGCGEAPGIRQYEVTRPEFVERGNVDVPQAPQVELEPATTWGAIWPRGNQAWFFKATASPEAVAGLATKWKEFVASVKFSDGSNPEWTLPEGWSQLPGNQFRFATLVMKDAAGAPIELTVSSLPRSPEQWDSQLDANLSRWKGQLGIGPMESSSVSQTTEKQGDDEVVFVLMQGSRAKGQGMMGGMSAPGTASTANMPAAESGQTKPPAVNEMQKMVEGEIKLTPPAEWKPGKLNAFRKAAYEVTRGDERVEITVIDLAGESGGLLENINRWRDQVGMPAIELAALTSELKNVKTANGPAQLIEIEGSKGQSILGAVLPRGDRTWFVKLQGSTPLAQQEKARFLEFLETSALP